MTIFNVPARVAGLALAFFLGFAKPTSAASGANVTLVSHDSIRVEQPFESKYLSAKPTHEFGLTVAFFPAAGWERNAVINAATQASAILAQCGIRLAALEVAVLQGDRYFQDFRTVAARELARRFPLRRPTVYFVADTLQQPAFDAEAIGQGNSRTRPELAGTVWVMRGARDLELVVAHELAHVLMDSGDHSTLPGNLMRDETAPENVALTTDQCGQLRRSGTRQGLLSLRR